MKVEKRKKDNEKLKTEIAMWKAAGVQGKCIAKLLDVNVMVVSKVESQINIEILREIREKIKIEEQKEPIQEKLFVEAEKNIDEEIEIKKNSKL